LYAFDQPELPVLKIPTAAKDEHAAAEQKPAEDPDEY
jgi:hypothetical protein